MFTLQKIYDAFDKVESDKDFASFFKDLKKLGIAHYDNFVDDGHTEYYDNKGNCVKSDPRYDTLTIGQENPMLLEQAIEQQHKGEMDFSTFCRAAAKSGVCKWITDLENMNVKYINDAGESMFTEPVSLV